MNGARGNPRVLAECLLSLVEDEEFVDPVDRQALAVWMAETLHLWRKRLIKG